MKILKSLLSLAALFLLTLIINCTGNVTPSLNLQQRAAKILDEGSPWGGVGNVDVLASPAGVNFAELEGLQLNFRTSGADIWAPTFFQASGAEDFLSTDNAIWVWTGSGTDNITLTEASVAELTGVNVTDTDVTFSFEVNPSSGGRVSGIDGSYTVRLK
jgi:hypothetical protein